MESGSVHIELELAYISAAEILTDLREAGMQVISLWGDYDLSPWGGDSSPRLLLAGVRSGS